MPRICTICTHPQRTEIETALVSRRPFRHIAEQFGVSTSALVRHHDEHLPEALSKATDAAVVANADTVLGHATMLRDRALSIMDRAEGTGDLKTALAAIRETRECVRLLGELAGKLQTAGTVNVILSAEWVQVQAVVLAALEPHPDARLAVAHALERIEQ